MLKDYVESYARDLLASWCFVDEKGTFIGTEDEAGFANQESNILKEILTAEQIEKGQVRATKLYRLYVKKRFELERVGTKRKTP